MKKESHDRNFPIGGAAFRFGLLLSVFLLGTSAANAQQNYWMARQTDTTYAFDQQVPQSFGEAITKPNSTQFQVVWDPQNFEPQTVDGTTYRFVKVSITSDYEMFENRLPKRSVSMKSKDGSGGAPQSWIEMSSSDPLVEAFASQLPSREMGKWFSADLIICVSPSGNQPQSVRMSPEAIHEQQLKQQLKQHEQIMGKFAENVSPGTYYPSVKKPADLLAFQQEMLRYGNLGRRDPDFRKRMGSKTATNLESDSVQTQNGPQKVFKTSSQAPYFRDHTLREDLNNLAQFQAEYQATIERVTHDGPGSHVLNGMSRNMASLGQRTEAFIKTPDAPWEACGGGQPGSMPNAWMTGETHFRPWFNVGDFHREVGYGAAQAASGTWYFAAVGIAKKDDAMKKEDAIELPANQKLSLPPGELTRGKRYLTADGSRFLMFAEDGNVVVGGAADDKYYWGLDARVGVNWQTSASAHVTSEGRFEVRDASGTVIWSIPDNPIPGSVLNLNPMGVPRMTKPGSQVESYSLPLAPGTTLQQGEKYVSADGQHYLLHAGLDNNFMIVRTAGGTTDDVYVWGLDQQIGNYNQAAVVRFNAAGILEVLDGSGSVIYQLTIGIPGSRLGLDANGNFTGQ